MTTRVWTGLLTVSVVAALSACATQTHCQRSSEPLESHRCMQQGSPAEAVATAAANTVAWGTAGCAAAGCNPPYECNEESGLCERARCGEGRACPPAFECDPATQRCR